MKGNIKNKLCWLGFVGLMLAGTACEDKSLPAFASDSEVNRWVEKEMERWYYWQDKLPANPDYALPTGSFFNNLLYAYDPISRPDGDRFSWIQRSADELVSSLSGVNVTYGMEYRIVSISTLNKVVGVVIYTLPGSPADKAGLKRGDFFTEINGTEITGTNYRTLLSGANEKKFTIASFSESGTFDPRDIVSLTPVRIQEDPVHYHSIIEAGNKRIGYVVYHQFFPSTNGTNDQKFDKKLETIFQGFRDQHINELIIDLRYNGGGYVSSAVLLGSLIAKNVTSKDIFAIKEYNPRITEILRRSYGDDYFNDYFLNKPQNVGSLIDRVFIITTGNTASASELLINGLAPYLPVKVVGGTTVGKNVGSVTLMDTYSRTRWGIQPIVSKSFNSLRKSEYSEGFTPDYPASEPLQLYPYGDLRDPLLKAAYTAITGPETNARTAIGGGGALSGETFELTTSIASRPGRSSMFEIIPPGLTVEEQE